MKFLFFSTITNERNIFSDYKSIRINFHFYPFKMALVIVITVPAPQRSVYGANRTLCPLLARAR